MGASRREWAQMDAIRVERTQFDTHTHIPNIKLSLFSGENHGQTQTSNLYNGHIDVVELLLGHRDVDPTAKNNISIQNASQMGHVDVVKLLLQLGHHDVDPAAYNGQLYHSRLMAYLYLLNVSVVMALLLKSTLSSLS